MLATNVEEAPKIMRLVPELALEPYCHGCFHVEEGGTVDQEVTGD